MLETFVAYMLICSLNGDKCTWASNPSVPWVKSVAACHVQLDEIQKRIERPDMMLSIYDRIGNWQVNATHRGICIDGRKKITPRRLANELKQRYDL